MCMDLDTLGYFLFMESQEQPEKGNPFLTAEAGEDEQDLEELSVVRN